MSANTTYKKFAQYYDLYVEGFDKDLELYKSLCKPENKLLEIGCGSGRVLKSFLEDGFHITGVDISTEMLEVAQKKLGTFSQKGTVFLKLHNFMNQPLSEKYDKVFVTFYTFNYILENPETFLGNIFTSMSTDSMIVMDLFYPKTLANKESDNVWTTHDFQYQGRLIQMKDKRSFSGGIEERFQVYVENGEETRITTVRKYYLPEELKELLKKAGFQDILFSESYDVKDFKEQIHIEDVTKNFLVRALKRA